MEKKINFLETQVDFYDQYLKQCLANLHAAKKKRVHFRTSNHLVKIILLFNAMLNRPLTVRLIPYQLRQIVQSNLQPSCLKNAKKCDRVDLFYAVTVGSY